MTTEERIRELIVGLPWNGSRSLLTSDYPLIDNHVLDSLELMNLIGALEEEFAIEVRDDELMPDNFASIAEIAAFVDSKRAS